MSLSKEDRNRKDRTRRYERLDQARTLLGDVCAKCGSTDRLEFDHIDPNTKLFGISKKANCSSSKFWTEVRKCQLLCHWCHVRKTADDNATGMYVHGTRNMYNRHGCRCEPCRNWKRSTRNRQRPFVLANEEAH